MKKPQGFDDCLSDFKVVSFDSCCGEPVAWGFNILHNIGDERFSQLGRLGTLKYISVSSWALVTKVLTREEAEAKYGPITDEVFGPRGGWKSITFGKTKFISEYLKP